MLDTQVYRMEGLGRFYMGLAGEIQIIDAPKLKEYAQKKEQPLDRWESVPDFLLYLHYQVKVMARRRRVIFHIDVC